MTFSPQSCIWIPPPVLSSCPGYQKYALCLHPSVSAPLSEDSCCMTPSCVFSFNHSREAIGRHHSCCMNVVQKVICLKSHSLQSNPDFHCEFSEFFKFSFTQFSNSVYFFLCVCAQQPLQKFSQYILYDSMDYDLFKGPDFAFHMQGSLPMQFLPF